MPDEAELRPAGRLPARSRASSPDGKAGRPGNREPGCGHGSAADRTHGPSNPGRVSEMPDADRQRIRTTMHACARACSQKHLSRGPCCHVIRPTADPWGTADRDACPRRVRRDSSRCGPVATPGRAPRARRRWTVRARRSTICRVAVRVPGAARATSASPMRRRVIRMGLALVARGPHHRSHRSLDLCPAHRELTTRLHPAPHRCRVNARARSRGWPADAPAPGPAGARLR